MAEMAERSMANIPAWPSGHRFVIQFQLSGEFSSSFAFANASHQQDGLHRRPLTALKDGSGVQVVNRSAIFTTMYFQFAGLSAPKLS